MKNLLMASNGFRIKGGRSFAEEGVSESSISLPNEKALQRQPKG